MKSTAKRKRRRNPKRRGRLTMHVDGIDGRIVHVTPHWQFALGKVASDEPEGIYRRRASEADTYGGWRWEARLTQLATIKALYAKNPRGNPKRRTARRRRRNPVLTTYLANPGKRVQIASDVQAVLYRHAKDGGYYLHVFGNQTDGTIKRIGRGEWLRIDNLPARTGVRLEAAGPVLVVRHKNGKPLEAEF